jgi:hypothetical protein
MCVSFAPFLSQSIRRRRRRAALLAWRASASLDAALVPSRFKARRVARDRLTDGLRVLPPCPALYARAALFRVRSDV